MQAHSKQYRLKWNVEIPVNKTSEDWNNAKQKETETRGVVGMMLVSVY